MTLDRLIRRKDVAHLVGFSSRHLARLERAGEFPRRVQAGARAVRWSELEVLRWVEQKKTERHGV